MSTLKTDLWLCGLTKFNWMEFHSSIQLKKTHFLYLLGSQVEKIGVVTLSPNTPFKISQEDSMPKLRYDFEIPEEFTGHMPPIRTWKAWGSNFIKDFESSALFENISLSDHFEYFIYGHDHFVEFISPKAEPEIRIFGSYDPKEVLRYLLEEELKNV